MEYLSSAVDMFKKDTSATLQSGQQESHQPQHEASAEQISHKDLLHLTMKLSQRLKVTEASLRKTESELTSEHNRVIVLCKAVERSILHNPTANLESKNADELTQLLDSEEDLLGLEESSGDLLDKAITQRDALASKVSELEQALVTQRCRHEEELVFLRHQIKVANTNQQSVDRIAHLEKDVADKEFRLSEFEKDVAQKESRLSEFEKDVVEKEAQLTRLRAEMTARDNANAIKTKENAKLLDRVDAVLHEAAALRKQYDLVLWRLCADTATGAAATASTAASAASATAALAVPEAALARFATEELKHRLEQEYARKSVTARQIVVERDAEIAKLAARCTELERDAATGGHAHRRILEIAEQQSQRDGRINNEVRSQKIANIRLHRLLKKRDAELAELQLKLARLRSNHRTVPRSNLDLEYVKNVVVHYLSLPSGCSERASLVPVLATVLHFTDADMKRLAKSVDAPTLLHTIHRCASPPLDLETIDTYRRKTINIPDEFDA